MVKELLSKGAIALPKKDGRQRPVINLKRLNQFIPCQQFKLKGLHYFKELMLEEDETRGSSI